jgi:hypothetical protein
MSKQFNYLTDGQRDLVRAVRNGCDILCRNDALQLRQIDKLQKEHGHNLIIITKPAYEYDVMQSQPYFGVIGGCDAELI